MLIAALPLANGLNAHTLRRWVVEAERVGTVAVSGHRALGASAVSGASGRPGFVAVQMPSPPAVSAQPDIHIELTRGPTTIIIRWPSSRCGACATWLRELLR